jgi:alginate O-acetyltransferase complex protein AlgI
MLFNSIEFLIFLPAVFLLYWFVLQKYVKVQNLLLLTASYVFYGWWDWRFLSLIFISSAIDYTICLFLHNTTNQKKRNFLLLISLVVNLGLLGFFKYFNFFIGSISELISGFGLKPNVSSLRLILPVGISFYTFQTLSYTIDVFNKKIEPTKDIIAFFAFVSFFPQLVAGPIERASNLLPQFQRRREFSYPDAVDGLRQILGGFAKKVIIADTCAVNADYIFSNYETLQGSVLFAGLIFFAFQIYGDFSGYSDIAIGTARLFGFSLMRNFSFPYFSRNIAEFWRRWHISLSSWFRDYVYIPLGGSHVSPLRRIFNILVTFTVSGLWHGANWTFIFWGFLNGLYYIPNLLFNKHKAFTVTIAENRFLPGLKEIAQVFITFGLTLFAWIFFRAASMAEAFDYIRYIFSGTLFRLSIVNLRGRGIAGTLFEATIAISILLIVEWINRKKQHSFQIDYLPAFIRRPAYVVLTFMTLFYFGGERTFIYFQF